jgi:hypothetical protein
MILAGCVTETVNHSDDGKRYLDKQINEIVARLPNQDGMDLYADISHLVAFGNFAVDPMIECLDSDNSQVRSSAALVLGQLKAGKALDKLIRVAFNDENKLVKLEAARAVLDIGKWDTIPVLIDGLDDGQISTRQLCEWALETKTGESFGYAFDAPEEERLASIEKWQEWWRLKIEDPTFRDNLAVQ